VFESNKYQANISIDDIIPSTRRQLRNVETTNHHVVEKPVQNSQYNVREKAKTTKLRNTHCCQRRR